MVVWQGNCAIGVVGVGVIDSWLCFVRGVCCCRGVRFCVVLLRRVVLCVVCVYPSV